MFVFLSVASGGPGTIFTVRGTRFMPFSDLILIGLVALFVTGATVLVVWYVVKAVFPDEVANLQFFLTFIVVVIPFVIILCFGSALIIYNAITAPPWPRLSPLYRDPAPHRAKPHGRPLRLDRLAATLTLAVGTCRRTSC